MSSFLDLARHLVAVAERARITAPMLVGADPVGALDVHLVHRPVDEQLLGWRAPPNWDAAVLLGMGQRRDPGAPTPSLAVLVERERPARALLDGAVMACDPCPLTDVLHRCLGFPTPPPGRPPSHLATAVWLHRLLEIVTEHPSPERLRFDDLARRHPLLLGHPASPDAVRRMLTDLDRGCGWRRLASLLPQRRSASRRWSPCDWFDAGSFERWLLPQLPDTIDALADLACLLHPSAVAAVRRATHPSR